MMLKNHWTSFFYGYTKVVVEGRLLEPFLNHSAKMGIHMWEMKRTGEESFIAYVQVKDVKALRHYARAYHCKLRFIERRGLPFLQTRALRNSGFVGGLLAFIVLLFVLSNMVWGIEIKGAEPDVEHALRKAVNEYGIKRGKLIITLPDTAVIQRELTLQVDGLTWLGVERKGTTYHFQVVEEKKVELQEVKGPQHLVAKKRAVIHDMFVEEGQPIVSVDDFVDKGDVLVSGIIGKEGQTKMAAAKGEVLGEVWYQSRVVVPLKTKFSVLTGEKQAKHLFYIGNFSFPFWGFKEVPYEAYETNTKKTPFLLLNWTTPFAYEQKLYLEKKQSLRQYDQKTAVMEGKKMAKKELISRIGKDAVIKGEKVLHQAIENGKVKLTIHYQVIEDIAVEQPIIQGD
ncbi:sporulation protein YqfD [Bacillus tianshenii]|nr:sporulation protein YqfD [Bacillus tianshenii]